MAAKKVTTNEAKMKQTAGELENIYTALEANIKKMRELVQSTKSIWTDENVTEYIKGYEKKEPDLVSMAKVIVDCSAALKEISDDYARADMQALDAIKSTMGGK